MKTYQVKVEYPTFETTIFAKNKKEAEELGWYEYDQASEKDKSPYVAVKEIKQ